MGRVVKRLAVLGSTGSIGRQTLEVVRAFPDRFQVVGLAAGRNLELLVRQVQEFRPRLVSVAQGGGLGPVGDGIRVVSLEEMAADAGVELVVVATSGKAGLGPTLAAIQSGKAVALANKEVLVMAGEFVTGQARRCGVDIRPIDSEHSAIWQCLRGEESEGSLKRIMLTASGGPFYRLPREGLERVTPEEALRHPTWQMGRKVTIDSATLMNKGMEVIEAHWLFGVPFSQIEVIIHPESLVHSLVEFVDGSVKAQLSPPDMRLPIQHALTYPERLPYPELPRLDLLAVACLHFQPPDLGRFPCLGLAREAGRRGGTYPAALAAADEVAVGLFLEGRIGLMDIAQVVERTLELHQGREHPSLEEVLAADAWARETALEVGARGRS